jgi:outer membrane lipoprotein-sorting protein
MHIVILIFFFISMSMSANALADDWSPGDQADIAAAQGFFNGLDTYRAQFVQISPEGSHSEGWLWLQRPHYFRVEYAPPTNLLLVANGVFLIFMDRDIDQISKYSYESGPFRFLLREKVDLAKDMVVNAIDRNTNLLRLTLVDEDDLKAGSITISFSEEPMRLVGWTVTDSQGLKTEITLHDHSFGLRLPKKLFRFTEHDQVRKDYRYGVYD